MESDALQIVDDFIMIIDAVSHESQLDILLLLR